MFNSIIAARITNELHDAAQIWHQGQEDLRQAIKNVKKRKKHGR